MFSIERPGKLSFRLTEDDACFFRHPNIDHLRLVGVDISFFAKVQFGSFQPKNLHSLYVDMANYTQESLKRLIQSSTSLTSIEISQPYEHKDIQSPLPCSVTDHIPILAEAASTLQVLKLRWLGFPQYIGDGMDLRMCTALSMLAVPSQFLAGDYNEYEDDPGQLIADRLPPNLRTLVLEDVVSRYWVHSPNTPIVPPNAVQLIRSLIEQKETQVSSLDCILITSHYTDIDFPESLYSFAKEHEVRIGIELPVVELPLGWFDDE